MIPPGRLRWIQLFLAGLVGSVAGWTLAAALLVTVTAHGPLTPEVAAAIGGAAVSVGAFAAWIAWTGWTPR